MPVVYGKAEMIHKGSEIALVAVGSMVETACEVRKILKEKGLDVTVVNERFIKPIDAGMIHKLSFDHKLIVTMEENVGLGGFGDTVCQYADDSQLDVQVLNIALPDDYVEHGNVSILKKKKELTQQVWQTECYHFIQIYRGKDMAKERLDVLLVNRGLAVSREKQKQLLCQAAYM